LGATGAGPHPGAAVAGVQLALRQQSPEAFFQTSPLALRQLSMAWAEAKLAKAEKASKATNLFKFFMIYL
jgi:hypothetical protein